MNKVLFVIPYMHEGGAQRALSNIQKSMTGELEMDTLINSEHNRAYPNSGKVISLNIDKEAKSDSKVFQIGVFFKRFVKLRSLKKSNDYKACISFVDSANVANILTSWHNHFSQTKTIVSVRTSITEASKRFPQYKYVVSPLAKRLYKKADKIVAVSEELKNELIREYGFDSNKVIPIRNGFDLKEIRDLSVIEVDPVIGQKIKNKKVVFTAGRLNAAKNQWHLIRAFSIVKEKVPDSVLIVAGTGELKEYLLNTINAMDLSDSVILIGFEANVYRYMRIADVFVLPSGFEGFPNALGEALCVGAPCVSTDFKTGARELLAPELLFCDDSIEKVTECKYGIISPVCSGIMYKGNEPLEPAEGELASAMIRMMTEEALNWKYRSMSVIRGKELDIQTVVNKWIEVIEG